MSVLEFHKAYASVRSLPSDANKLETLGTKAVMAKHLFNALSALEIADRVIAKQSDSIMSTNAALVKQCLKAESLPNHAGVATPNTQSSSTPQISQSTNMQKKPPTSLFLKPKDSNLDFNSTNIQKKLQDTLKNVNVSSTRVTNQGNLIINLPDTANHSQATKSLKNAFTNSVEFDLVRKIPLKIIIVGLPNDFEQENLAAEICSKDTDLKSMMDVGNSFQILNCWEMKNDDGQIVSKKVSVRVSPEIRNHLINRNQGYVYLNLARYKVYDRLDVMQCYHCYSYNHIASSCPNKTKAPTCGRCASQHETKKCKSITEKCINCSKSGKQSGHVAFSYKCPAYEKERSSLASRTDYETKNVT